MRTRRYRVVTDAYLGFEVQVWRWWWPFWMQCQTENGPSNTWSSLERAEEFAKHHAAGLDRPKFKPRVVKNL